MLEYCSVSPGSQPSEKGCQEHQIKLFSSAVTWAGFSHVSYRQSLYRHVEFAWGLGAPPLLWYFPVTSPVELGMQQGLVMKLGWW